jgi:hypothetical protein
VNQHVSYVNKPIGRLNGKGFIVVRFTPEFAWNEDATRYFFRSTSGYASPNQISFSKGNLAASSAVLLYIGTGYAYCAGADFSAFWLNGQENCFVISLNGISSAMWLNGNSLAVSDTAMGNNSLSGIFIGLAGNSYKGAIKEILIGNRSLTSEDAARFYANDWEQRADSSRFIVSLPSELSYRKPTDQQLLPDGDMEAVDVLSWTVANLAVPTKQTASPHGGVRNLRVAYGGAGSPYVYQTLLTVGYTYRVSGWARGNNLQPGPAVYNAGTALWTGTASPIWQYFDVTFVATATTLRLYSRGVDATDYAEYDDIFLEEIQAVTETGGQISSVSGVKDVLLGSNGQTASEFPTAKDCCLSFDGGDTLTIPHNDALSFTDGITDKPFSIAVMCQLDTVTSRAIVSKNGTSGILAGEYFLASVIAGGTRIYFATVDEVNNAYIARYGLVPLGRKYVCLVGTYSGSKTPSGFRVYTDALRIDTTDATAGAYARMRTTNKSLLVGGSNASYTGYLGTMPVRPIIEPVEWSQLEVEQITEKLKSLYAPARRVR